MSEKDGIPDGTMIEDRILTGDELGPETREMLRFSAAVGRHVEAGIDEAERNKPWWMKLLGIKSGMARGPYGRWR